MPDTTLRFADYAFDASTLELRHTGRRVDLSPTPARALLYLAERANHVVSREELIDHIWPDVSVTDASLATAIRLVRRALSAGDAGHSIKTRRGQGYMFVGYVEQARRGCPSLSASAAPGSEGHRSPSDTSTSASAISATASPPDGVRQSWRPASITSHALKRLNPDTRRLLDAAAVVGPAVHPDVARVVSGLTLERMRAALIEAERLGILTASAERAIRFARPDLRATIHAELAPDTRDALEAAVADVVLDFDDDAPCRVSLSEQLGGLLGLLERTRSTLESLETIADVDERFGSALLGSQPRIDLARVARALEGDLLRADNLARSSLEAAGRHRSEPANQPCHIDPLLLEHKAKLRAVS